MNSKWQINRVGLLDFWYYDEEEFDFLDGRMRFEGRGSGKSVTMQSFRYTLCLRTIPLSSFTSIHSSFSNSFADV